MVVIKRRPAVDIASLPLVVKNRLNALKNLQLETVQVCRKLFGLFSLLLITQKLSTAGKDAGTLLHNSLPFKVFLSCFKIFPSLFLFYILSCQEFIPLKFVLMMILSIEILRDASMHHFTSRKTFLTGGNCHNNFFSRY